MKIVLSTIDPEQFMVHPHELNGEIVYLIQPVHIGAKWRQDNKHFRSSVWNSEGELISASFPKFVNWGENPEVFPVPESLNNAVITEKLDGSLLIVSKYNGYFILRTRGTVDAYKMDNGAELELFKAKYPKVFEFESLDDTWDFSLLFEWYSPLNRIVVRYGDEPTWSLVGVVNHDSYSLWTQDWLDTLAKDFGCLRPATFKFGDISELLENVDLWEGKEGVVVYTQGGQMLHKIKSAWYLVRHRLKEEFGNYEKVLDFYVQEGCPSFKDFQTKIASVVDWETANEIIGDISRCCDGWHVVQDILNGMDQFVSTTLLPMGDPKDKKVRGQMAKKVLDSYGNTNRASFVFGMLDGNKVDKDGIKKLFYQVLKK